MSLWLLVVLMILASFRLTRLIVADTFPPIRVARHWLQSRRPTVIYEQDTHTYDEANKINQIKTYWHEDYWWLGELVGCAWCASAYVSGAVVLVVWALYGLPMPILVWLAVWGGSAWIASDKV